MNFLRKPLMHSIMTRQTKTQSLQQEESKMVTIGVTPPSFVKAVVCIVIGLMLIPVGITMMVFYYSSDRIKGMSAFFSTFGVVGPLLIIAGLCVFWLTALYIYYVKERHKRRERSLIIDAQSQARGKTPMFDIAGTTFRMGVIQKATAKTLFVSDGNSNDIRNPDDISTDDFTDIFGCQQILEEEAKKTHVVSPLTWADRAAPSAGDRMRISTLFTVSEAVYTVDQTDN